MNARITKKLEEMWLGLADVPPAKRTPAQRKELKRIAGKLLPTPMVFLPQGSGKSLKALIKKYGL